jgi:SAM-dependent methyltransferase
MSQDTSSLAGSAAIQGDLWSARPQDWADVQEIALRPLFTAILQEVMQGPHVDLLDVGCGSGLFAAMAAAASRVSGIDAAGALLTIAKRRTPQADFRVGEMESLPFDSRSFDVITGINSFQFAANPINALVEARRVGAPKARVIIATWGRPEECEAWAYFAALRSLVPAPPPGAPGPFALSADGALAALAVQAGLEPQDSHDVDCAFVYPNEATALRGMLSAGPAVEVMQRTSEEQVRSAVRTALQSFRMNGGGFHLKNRFRYLVAKVP